MQIKDIYRYPVKSMGGHSLSAADLSENGIPGDRCWAVKDEERGGIKGGKRFSQLMAMQAQLNAEPSPSQPSPGVTITLPDGHQVDHDDPEVNAKLSAALDAPVSLWPLLPKEQVDHYLRQPIPEDVDPEQYLRETFARTADEPLPDLSAFPEALFTYESPPGTYFDAYPLLVMTTATLAAIAAARRESIFDVRRFRPNIVLEVAEAGFVENQWQQRQARLGSAVLQFEMRCPRCVMTTHGFNDLPKDPQIMRSLVQANQGDLGIYASVIAPGKIQQGDRLEFI